MQKAVAVFLSIFMPVSLLTGCAKKPLSLYSKEIQTLLLNKARHFEVSGRIGFRNNQQAHSAHFHWHQHLNQYWVQIQSALAAYTVEITGFPHYVLVKDSKGKNLKTHTPEKTLEAQLGWFLPVQHLKYWLSGRVIPNQKIVRLKRDENKNLVFLEQSNWAIEYLAYENFKGFYLPQTMILKQNNTQIKLVFKHWQVN